MMVLALGLGGCDFQKLGSQATAKTVAVSTLLTTPAFELKAEAVASNGFDASIPDFDAGFVLDGGLLTTDAGVLVPAQNAAFVFFGQRQGDSLDSAPVGTAGATATLVQEGGGSWQLDDVGSGSYSLSPDAGFTYQDDATYTFRFVWQSQTYEGKIERVPTREVIPEFHPASGYVALQAGEAFSFTRPDPPQGEDRNFGFVNVFPINREGAQGEPTYSNIPTTPLAFLKLVAAPTDWKRTVVTIPGSAFPDADANYVILLQSAKLGGPTTDNLFLGSAILAGTSDIAIIKTH